MATLDDLLSSARQVVPSAAVEEGPQETPKVSTKRGFVHTTYSVTTASGLALDAEPKRRYALFVNDSDATIYLSLGGVAAANTGIRLNANGGSYEMSDELGNPYVGDVTAIHGSTGSKVLLITEGV